MPGPFPYAPIQYTEQQTQLFPGEVKIGDRNLWRIMSRLQLDFASATNKGATAFWMGAAIARSPSGTGFILANNAALATTAIGLATLGAPAGQPEIVQLQGLFSLDDWTPVTGTANLTALGFYWLDATSGKLTTTIPISPKIQTLVGYAISPRTLRIGIEQLATLGLAGPPGPPGPPGAPGAPGPAGPGLPMLAGYKTANQSTTSAAFVNVTSMAFAIAANEIWRAHFELWIAEGSLNKTTIQFTGPAAATLVSFYGNEFSQFFDATGIATGFSTPLALPDTGGWNGFTSRWRVILTVENGVNAGTVQLQFHSDGTFNLVMQQGCSFIASRLN